MINIRRISQVETLLWAKSDLCYSSLTMDTRNNTKWTQGLLFMCFHGLFMDFSSWMWLRDSSWITIGKKSSRGQLDWGRSVLRCGTSGIPVYIWAESWDKVFSGWIRQTWHCDVCRDPESPTGWMNFVVRVVDISTEPLWSSFDDPSIPQNCSIHCNSVGMVKGINSHTTHAHCD